MIRAEIFDLAGTLIDTEPPKGLVDWRAASELSPGAVDQAEVMGTCLSIVGVSELEAAQTVYEAVSSHLCSSLLPLGLHQVCQFLPVQYERTQYARLARCTHNGIMGGVSGRKASPL